MASAEHADPVAGAREYEAPTMDELGDVVEMTHGSADTNIRDAKDWYW